MGAISRAAIINANMKDVRDGPDGLFDAIIPEVNVKIGIPESDSSGPRWWNKTVSDDGTKMTVVIHPSFIDAWRDPESVGLLALSEDAHRTLLREIADHIATQVPRENETVKGYHLLVFVTVWEDAQARAELPEGEASVLDLDDPKDLEVGDVIVTQATWTIHKVLAIDRGNY